MDVIEQGMRTNNDEIKMMRTETKRIIKNITKVLLALYNRIGGNEKQLSYDDWEYHDEATVEEILQQANASFTPGKKRKTGEGVESTQDESQLVTVPAQSGLSGTGAG